MAASSNTLDGTSDCISTISLTNSRSNPASMVMGHNPTATKHVEYRRKPNFRQEAHFLVATNHKPA